MAQETNNEVVQSNEQQDTTTVNELDELRRKYVELQKKNTELEQKNAELEKKNAELQSELDAARGELNQLRGNVVDNQPEEDNAGLEEIPDLTESDIKEQLHGRNGRSVITKPEVVEAVNALEGNYKKEVSEFIKSGDIEGLQKYLNEQIEAGHIDKDKLKANLNEKGIPFEGQIKVDGYLGPQTLATIEKIIKEEKPNDTKEKPDDTKEKPDDTKENPDDTKENPDDTKENPDDTKENPDDTKENPDDTKDETPEHPPINLDELGAFCEDKDFSFKAGLEQQEGDKWFIDVSGERYYKYTDDITGKGYQKDRFENNGVETGRIYIGDYLNGKNEGYGVFASSDGDKYEGYWKNDKMEGEGILTIANGNKFEGRYMRDEMISGKYTIKIDDEEKVYEVIRENGIMKIVEGPDNVGKYVNQNKGGGEIVDNPESINLDDLGTFELDGNGNYEFKLRETPQEDSNGKYVEVLGEKYYEYTDNITGKGYKVEEASNDDLVGEIGIYIGNYENGQKQGKGTKIWGNGNKYEGEWENDRINGRGIFYVKDYCTYEGEFVDGKETGRGIKIYEDGLRHEGEYVDGVEQGQSTNVYNNGNKFEGEYEDGKIIRGKFNIVEPTQYAGEYEVEKDATGLMIKSGPTGTEGKHFNGYPDRKIVDN